jgi:muramoyltetrapeptide carboxypeptidase
MTSAPAIQKPKALRSGSRFAPIAPSSPAKEDRIAAGKKELERLGFSVATQRAMNSEGYFTGPASERRAEFLAALQDSSTDALIATRGGYGSVYLLDEQLPAPLLRQIKPLVGFSDLTTLQIYLWQRHSWVTFYGPMLAAGLDGGADAGNGYDLDSFRNALTKTGSGWNTDLHGEVLQSGSAEGILLGGAMTLLEATLGTDWELDTTNAILVLEDRAMKPYQIDRVLLHLKHAGKLASVRGVVLGDFPDCERPVAGSPSVRDVAQRILGSLEIPIVFGAPIGHTTRPLLTLPLGVRGRLVAEGSGTLEILEPAVTT